MTLDVLPDVVPHNGDSQTVKKSPKAKIPAQAVKVELDAIRADGYFDIEIRPLLENGQEEHLYDFLRYYNIIKAAMNCPNEGCNEKPLDWKAVKRSQDKYTWECTECKKRQSIREKSIFLKVQCDIRICMQLILAWCKSMFLEDAADLLDLKNFKVKKIYERLDRVAETYVELHFANWKLGGSDDKIVLVDEFPIGCMSEELMRAPGRDKFTIVCIAEVDLMKKKPKIWIHIISSPYDRTHDKKGNRRNYFSISEDMIQEALSVVQKMVLENSIVVANRRSMCCNYKSLSDLNLFRVFDIDTLQKYDMPGTNQLIKNLETIWTFATKLCAEVQKLNYEDGVRHIKTSQYKHHCCPDPSSGFRNILLHIPKTADFK